jgi:hypothetical protein
MGYAKENDLLRPKKRKSTDELIKTIEFGD